MMVKMQENRNSHQLLLGMQNGTATWKDILAISHKGKFSLTTPLSNIWYLTKVLSK